ncbi:hypothetical protein BD626DRAFT_408024 [Schizophyllum amplum]|uniref:Uncharacterized protein n=1 Tax=Schizophyllum amplum TaxID=97359 RepID=A0A550C5V9_9AGAR|nr:hypothetical protein BD626DRAFT_408024 [Auriculariopsis ampla]
MSSTGKTHASSTSTLVNHHRFSPHTPVPASILFSQDAAPLYLPKLDQHLSTLHPPTFVNMKGKQDAMFPPMDKLAASEKSLEDLETNATVAPIWRNRTTLLGGAVNIVVGLTGSSVLASYYSLQGVINTAQVFALILNTIAPVGGYDQVHEKWKGLFLGTIPNFLALNFASTLTESIIFLIAFMVVTSILLFYFHRQTRHCDRYVALEGLQSEDPGSRWGVMIVSFLLTVIYLPLSTIAVHVLIWSDDLWVGGNPYANATSLPQDLPALGDASEYRDPLDFCWTTTMKKNEINYAPVIIILASVVVIFVGLTVWFPISLRRVIKQSVDHYTELGRKRNSVEMDSEYRRLLGRDNNPFAFLYSGFRRNWGTYQSIYHFAKLSTLVITAVFANNNCVFRSVSYTTVPIVRQVLLLCTTIGFFIAQGLYAPFLDPVNNASEWVSRLNYVATSIVALVVIFDVPGKDVLNTYVLYVIYILTYGLSIYFSIINFAFVQRWIKRWTRRIDFSIDIFSPHLDLTPFSLHAKRRIWQESISTLLLTNTQCRIPSKQKMLFAEGRDSEYPPYLLDFAGSPGERHVENLKILREEGLMAYRRAVTLTTGPDSLRFLRMRDIIQQHYIGPDCYWRPSGRHQIVNCKAHFGNAWWIPFPPTLVIRYDEGPLAVIRELADFEAYIQQNSSQDIRRRKHVRLCLRALEGQTVRWPYEHTTPIGSANYWCCSRTRYTAEHAQHFHHCELQIGRRGHLVWKKRQLGSGFDVTLKYSKKVQVSGAIIGLDEDFDLTPSLARFLAMNEDKIELRLPELQSAVEDYRQHARAECKWKEEVLTYRFLAFVYDRPQDPTRLAESSIAYERDLRVRQLVAGSEGVFETAYERLEVVTANETACWWYIFWDDFWRRNRDAVKALNTHAKDFNPHYPTCVAYTPLARPVLETFLIQRGLMSKPRRRGDLFHSGFLNKLYLRLNQTVFHDTSRAIMFHYGRGGHELDMSDVDLETRGQPSTLGTGGGTDHDLADIRVRPTYRWEELLGDPVRADRRQKRRWMSRLGAWFGITPLWRSDSLSAGLSVDVRLEGGRYVLVLPEDVDPDRSATSKRSGRT